MPKVFVNLGGEGEKPNVINQQPHFAHSQSWRTTTIHNPGKSLAELILAGHIFVICPNDQLSFDDESVDVVYTNNVAIDRTTWLGPSPQSSEIKRILKVGGIWIHDGRVRWRKP